MVLQHAVSTTCLCTFYAVSCCVICGRALTFCLFLQVPRQIKTSNMAEKRPHETKSEPETESESELEVVTEICCSMVQRCSTVERLQIY